MSDILKLFIALSDIITILFAIAVFILLLCAILIKSLVWHNYKKRHDYE